MPLLAQHHARRLLTLTGSYVIIAPATLQERSSRRFLSGTNRQFTLQQSSDGQGAVRLYAASVYVGGYGGYISLDGYGEEFWFIGTRFVLSGFTNTDGADFEVYRNGSRIGTGSTYATSDSKGMHYDSGVLPSGLHRINTSKIAGRFAYFLDQLDVY